MSMPGWYPDPSGQQGQFRYWNGSTWSSETTGDPSRTPAPGGSAAGYGQQPRRGNGARFAVIGVVVLVVALVAWLVVRQFTGGDDIATNPDTNSATPTVSAWDETSSATPTPSDPKSSGATMIDCPSGESTIKNEIRDGRLWGGGISVESLGWRKGGISLNWVHDLSAESKSITPRWFSVSAVGALSVADGFEVPEPAARAMMSCFASSGYYNGFTGRKDTVAEEVTIDGHKGFHLRSEVYVDDQGSIKGDIIDVVVIDTGNPESMALYFSSATIDDTAVIAEVDRARGSIKVDQ